MNNLVCFVSNYPRLLEVDKARAEVFVAHPTDMVKSFSGENGIPAGLVGDVLNNDDVKMVLPLGMESQNLFASCSPADGSGYFVARLHQGVDNMSCQEGIGPGQKC